MRLKLSTNDYERCRCERDVDECQSAPCLNGGTCSDLRGGFSCACAANWHGTRCQLARTRSCAQEPCAPGRGACRPSPPDPPTGNNYTCECLEGWTGVHCERAFCEVAPCAHGACRADAVPPRCDCEPGWAGARCDAERDECLEAGDDACLHGGTCVDSHGGFLCDCDATGTPPDLIVRSILSRLIASAALAKLGSGAERPVPINRIARPPPGCGSDPLSVFTAMRHRIAAPATASLSVALTGDASSRGGAYDGIRQI